MVAPWLVTFAGGLTAGVTLWFTLYIYVERGINDGPMPRRISLVIGHHPKNSS